MQVQPPLAPRAALFTTLPVTSNTRFVAPGGTFVAIQGQREDGASYIPEALQRGAKKIVVDRALDRALREQIVAAGASLVVVSDARRSLALLSAKAHGYPALQLKLFGITGTKGKTTTSFLLEHLLATAGHQVALLSTVTNKIAGISYPTELTTQHPDYIHFFLRACLERGVTHVVVEVAAQAVTLHRVATLLFDSVIFTNFSQEHGEFYATQDDYFAAKAALLAQLKEDAPVLLNEDDARVAALASSVRRPLFFPGSRFVGESSLAGLTFEDAGSQFRCPALVGSYNMSNALAAIRCARLQGISEETLQKGLASFSGVPGRLDVYRLPKDVLAIIDYAHTPSSVEQVVRVARQLSSHVIVVTGAGGDRDREKRPLMAKIAAEFADLVFITTDNPRSESPAAIAEEMVAGVPAEHRAKVVVELDREAAIRAAYARAQQGTVMLLLGKGPDEYQIIGHEKVPFSERAILQSLR